MRDWLKLIILIFIGVTIGAYSIALGVGFGSGGGVGGWVGTATSDLDMDGFHILDGAGVLTIEDDICVDQNDDGNCEEAITFSGGTSWKTIDADSDGNDEIRMGDGAQGAGTLSLMHSTGTVAHSMFQQSAANTVHWSCGASNSHDCIITSGVKAAGATNIGFIKQTQQTLATAGQRHTVWKNGTTEVASLYADGEVQIGKIESTAPAENIACAVGTTGTMVYVDDTDDTTGDGEWCGCTATADDGAGTPNAFDWLIIGTTTPCSDI